MERDEIRTLLSMPIQHDRDVVVARQRATRVAELLGLDRRGAAHVATSVSEIARNALRHGGGGSIEFQARGGERQELLVVVSDHGPGIPQINDVLAGRYRSEPAGGGMGIIGARRLMDAVRIESHPERGTRVEMAKALPDRVLLGGTILADIADQLTVERPVDPSEELQRQNRELLSALDELQKKQDDLARLNKELEDTNRGVVALYAELDERAERLRQADEIKSRFLSNMSHEFRTPLNSILALSRILLDRTDGEINAEQEKQINFIKKSAQDLTELVNDLLDLAKVEAGRTEVHPSTFAVEDMLGALRGVLRPLLTDDSVVLIFEPLARPLAMVSDEGKISQILRNLISNALKYTDRGEVRVSVAVSGAGDDVTFSVSDTGIGIAQENLAVIFEEFGQVRNKFQQRFKGTGLGLPLSRRLAELLGGQLTVESTPGVGSIFSVTLPRILHLETETIEADGVEVDANLPTVLVIDDEDAPRYYLTKMIAEVPCNVIEASRGGEGLATAMRRMPSLIFLDLIMPDIDGFEVLRRLAAREDTARIPVVVVTSKALTDDERKALSTYATRVLSKSTVSSQIIADVIQELIYTADPPNSDATARRTQ
jgi:signal transduction histidine kinase/CheY-like chemotaxis protein